MKDDWFTFVTPPFTLIWLSIISQLIVDKISKPHFRGPLKSGVLDRPTEKKTVIYLENDIFLPIY